MKYTAMIVAVIFITLQLTSSTVRGKSIDKDEEVLKEIKFETRYDKSITSPNIMDLLMKQSQKSNDVKRRVFSDFYDYVKRHTVNYQARPAMPFRIGKRFQDD